MEKRGVRTHVYSMADMNAEASPPVMGMEAVRREVTGRRFPDSGMSLNWRVYLPVEVEEDGGFLLMEISDGDGSFCGIWGS